MVAALLSAPSTDAATPTTSVPVPLPAPTHDAARLPAAAAAPMSPGPAATVPAPPARSPSEDAPACEILWDEWGVPHIYGRTAADAFRGFGWAQLQAHGDVVLQAYARARGRAAALWGVTELEHDLWIHTLDVPGRAQRWYDQQTADFRACLDAFAAGMNAFAEAHPEQLSTWARAALPVRPTDVLAHAQRRIHFSFVAPPAVTDEAAAALARRGSNACALAPSRSTAGHALLLANPHLGWAGADLLFEAQLVAPGVDVTGCTLVGMPVLMWAFNDRLGWAHTSGTADGADAYLLELAGDGYRFGDRVQPFDVRSVTLSVREPFATRFSTHHVLRTSLHGPVVATRERSAVALRVVGLDEPGMLAAWWDLARARDLAGFEAVLERLAIPTFNVIYADADGHVMAWHGGRIPVREVGDGADWSGLVPGGQPSTLWHAVHPYEALPRVLDPPGGWVQNANDPPWLTSLPSSLAAEDHADLLLPRRPTLRAQQLIRRLRSRERFSLDDLVALKHDTHVPLAERVLPDLLAAGHARPAGGDPDDRRLARALEVLGAWDLTTDADARGAALFVAWSQSLGFEPGEDRHFAEGWDARRPLSTPRGLADPAAALTALADAAARVEQRFGRLDVPWGVTRRLRIGDHDLPASGGPGDPTGVIRSAWFDRDDPDQNRQISGDTCSFVVEFSDPPRARILTAYGNASQPGSPHVGDQLALHAEGRMRPVWRRREEVEAHTVQRTLLPDPER